MKVFKSNNDSQGNKNEKLLLGYERINHQNRTLEMLRIQKENK